MPGRNFVSSNKYRYTFNGKETDPETGTQDYGMRIYNPAIGKFLSVDPLQKEYPFLTPYQFASNNPIMGIDLDGLEFAHYSLTYSDGKPVLKLLGMQTRFIGTGQSLAETMSLGAVKYSFDEYSGAVIDGFAGIYVHTDNGSYYFNNAEQVAQFAVNNGANSTASIEQMEQFGTMLVGVTLLWADAQNGTIENLVTPKVEVKPETKPQAAANNGVEPNGVKKTDYTGIDPAKGAKEGANFTQKQKQAILEKNKQANGGVLRDDVTGEILNQPKKDVKGVKTDMNSAQVDHVKAKSRNGTNAGSNANVRSKRANTKKSNKEE